MYRNLLFSVLGLIMGAAALPIAEAQERPNILLLVADDWGLYGGPFRGLPGYGGASEIVKTPMIDRIAASGVVFQNAHASAPSCTPSRGAIFTGQQFWRLGRGAILSGAYWDNIPSFPVMLRDSGYHIGHTLKVWSPGDPPNAPFGGQTYKFERAGARFNSFSSNVSQMVVSGKSLDEAKSLLYQEVRENFRRFLDANAGSKPFCYWFGPVNTHRPWKQGSGKALWSINPDSLIGKLPPAFPDVPEVREDLADYLGEVQAWDAGVGVLISELEARNQLANTLIIITADNGEPGFPKGKSTLYRHGTGVPLIISGPGVRGGRVVTDFTDLSGIAPTVLQAAGLPTPPFMTAAALQPVLSSDVSGQVDPARTFVVVGRERHVVTARPSKTPYPSRAIRTSKYVLIRNFQPSRWPMGVPYLLDSSAEPSYEALATQTGVTIQDEDASPTKAWIVTRRNSPEGKPFFDMCYQPRPAYELYDLTLDPSESHNVADVPSYKNIRDGLVNQLHDELRRTGDPRLTGGGNFFETPPMSGN